jgi:hypothetical protein
MIDIKRKESIHLMLRAAGCLTTIALAYIIYRAHARASRGVSNLNAVNFSVRRKLNWRLGYRAAQHHRWNHRHRMQQLSTPAADPIALGAGGVLR